MMRAGWLMLLIVLSSCAERGNTATPAEAEGTRLIHERTMCFGPCPAFELTWNGDGSALLKISKGFPDDEGAKLSPGHYFRDASAENRKALLDILALSHSMNFADLGGTYDNPMIMDLPTIRTRIDGVEVVDRFEGPDLVLLYDAIETWIRTGTWTQKPTENQ